MECENIIRARILSWTLNVACYSSHQYFAVSALILRSVPPAVNISVPLLHMHETTMRLRLPFPVSYTKCAKDSPPKSANNNMEHPEITLRGIYTNKHPCITFSYTLRIPCHILLKPLSIPFSVTHLMNIPSRR